MVVGKAKFIAIDRPCYRQAYSRQPAAGDTLAFEISLDSLLRAGVVRSGEDFYLMQLVVTPQRKTGIGATNVTNQQVLHLRFSRLR